MSKQERRSFGRLSFRRRNRHRRDRLNRKLFQESLEKRRLLAADYAGDNFDAAHATTLQAKQVVELRGVIGDGDHADLDVDLFKVQLTTGQSLQIDVDASLTDSGEKLSSLDSYLRIFDQSGNELARNSAASAPRDAEDTSYARDSFLTFEASTTGEYFIGVSGESTLSSEGSNDEYDPLQPGSGVRSSIGEYLLQLTAGMPDGPSLSVSDETVSEAAGVIQFEVALSEPVEKEVTANFVTVNQTAIAGADYEGQSGILTFAPGETTQTVTVAIFDDAMVNESSIESFYLELSDVVGITVADGIANAGIVNNEFQRGDFEGDHLGHAMPVSLSANEMLELEATIGDGIHGGRDVDLFRLDLNAGQSIRIDVDATFTDSGVFSSTLDSYLRIFNAAGNELQNNSEALSGNDFREAGPLDDSYLEFTASNAGEFYVGVSGQISDEDAAASSNLAYDPATPGSGVESTKGNYKLQLYSSESVFTSSGEGQSRRNPAPALIVASHFSIETDDAAQRTVALAGELSRNASAIEIDVNLDGTADYSAQVAEDLTFSLAFSEPDHELPAVNFIIVDADTNLTEWTSLETFLSESNDADSAIQNATLSVERIIGDPDDSMSGVQTVRGEITNADTFDSVTLEIDYEGDQFTDAYFDLSGIAEFEVQVMENAIGEDGQARLAAINFTTGVEFKGEWQDIAESQFVGSGSDDGATDGGTDADDDGAADSSDGASNDGDSESLVQLILAASSSEDSPEISFASSISTTGNPILMVAGNIVKPSSGTYVTAYRLNGDTLTELGTTTLLSDDSTDYRILSPGALAAGDQVLVHQHLGDGLLGVVSAKYDVAAHEDSDADGISAAMEAAAPGGDGNGDGILDSQQANVATLVENATGTVTTFDAGAAELVGVANYLPDDLTVAAFVPQGLYSFEVHGVTPGGVHAVDVYLDPQNDFAAWMKVDPATGEVNDFVFDGVTGAVKTDFGFTLHFQDGGRGDDDGIANGIIVDPSGPSFGISGQLNLGYWPEAPAIYQVEIDPLAGLPAGLDDNTGDEGPNDSIPESIQELMDAAFKAYRDEVAIHRDAYKESTKQAEEDYESSKSAASAIHQAALAAATNAFDATTEGYLPSNLEDLKEALKSAEIAYEQAYDAAIAAIHESATAKRMKIMEEQAQRDLNIHDEYRRKRDEIIQSAQGNDDLGGLDGGGGPGGGMDSGGIDMEAVAAALNAARIARDHALIESGKTAAVAHAALESLLATQTANAAQAEYERLMNAANRLRKAVSDNQYDYKDLVVEAWKVRDQAIAEANASYTKALADAKQTRDDALVVARKTRASADNASLTRYGKTITALRYDAIVSNAAGLTSRISTYRLGVAAEVKKFEIARLDAAKLRRDAYIDADATFDGVITDATATQTRDQAESNKLFKQTLATAKNTFHQDYYGERRADAKEAADDQNTATQAFDAVQRNYDASMGVVNGIRATRTPKELSDNQKAQASNESRYEYGLISKETFEATRSDLITKAADIRRKIAKETFGRPPQMGADGNLPPQGENDPLSEARVSMERFVEGSNATMNREIALSERKAEFSASLRGWSLSYEGDVKTTTKTRADENAATLERTKADVSSAMGSWTRTIASAEAQYTSSIADAYKNYRIRIATLLVGYENGRAADRTEAITQHASDNPSNIWAKYESAKAKADLARTNSVTQAYHLYVGSVAPAEAQLTHDMANRQLTYAQVELDAAVALENAIFKSFQLHDEEMRDADIDGDANRRRAIAEYESSVLAANQDYDGEEKVASVLRDADKLNALLEMFWEIVGAVLTSNYLEQQRILIAKRVSEADAGTDYNLSVINARSQQLGKIADAYQKRSTDMANHSDSFVSRVAKIREDNEIRILDAVKIHDDTIANEAKSYQWDTAGYSFTFQTATINADESYRKSIVQANAIHAQAFADARAEFEKDLAAVQTQAVALWAGDGVNDPITHYEDYVIDAYAAKVIWTGTYANAIRDYEYKTAAANQSLMETVFTESATRQRAEAAATQKYLRDNAIVIHAFETTAIEAETDESKKRSRAVSKRTDEGAATNASFGGNLADRIRTYRSGTLTASKVAATGLTEAIATHHVDRDAEKFSAAQAAVMKDREIAMAAVDAERAAGIAGDINTWGSELASGFKRQVESESTAVKERITNITSAWKTAVDENDEDWENRRVSLRAADESYENRVQAAVELFVSTNGVAYLNAVEKIGNAGQVYTVTLAEAEVDHHVATQNDLVSDMLASYGPTYSPHEAWEIRVARGQLAYLQDFASDYVTYVTENAKIQADHNDATAAADIKSDNAKESAATTYIGVTGGAWTEISSRVGQDTLLYYSDSTTTAVAHSHENARANDVWVIDTVDTSTTYATDLLEAETGHYKALLKQYHIRVQERHDVVPAEPSSDQYLEDFNADLANADYGNETGRMDANHDRQDSLIEADHKYIDSKAVTRATYTDAIAEHEEALANAFAAAYHVFSLASADAQQERDKSIARADHDRQVNSAGNYRDVLLAHYAAAKAVMVTFASVPDVGVRTTVAEAIANDAWAKELGPKFVAHATTVAVATQQYNDTTIDAIRAASESVADSQKAYIQAMGQVTQQAKTDNANILRDAIKANAAAQATHDHADNEAQRTYALRIATLRRDARIETGYYGDHRVDEEARQAAITARTAAQSAADVELAAQHARALATFYTRTHEISKHQQVDSANQDFSDAVKIADAIRDLDRAYNDAFRDYQKAVAHADADYAVATVDARITWLRVVRDANDTVHTRAAYAAAVTGRDDEVSEIQSKRAAALAAADTAHAAQAEVINEVHQKSLEDAASEKTSMIGKAQAAFDAAIADGPGTMALPFYEAPTHFSSIVSTEFSLPNSVEEITRNLSFGDNGAAFQVEVPNGIGGLQDEISSFIVAPNVILTELIYQNPSEAGHLVLDVIGLIPAVGIFADLINGVWYTIEGDGINASLSFVSAIPAAGYAASAVKGACWMKRAARFTDIAANVGMSGVAMIEGGYQIAANPDSAGGYLQVGMGMFGLGINMRAGSRWDGGCFDAGTLVHLPVNVAAIHNEVWADTNFLSQEQGTGLGRTGFTDDYTDEWGRETGDGNWESLARSRAALVEAPPASRTVPIEQIRLGQRVLGENPELQDVDPDIVDPIREQTRCITATILKEDGNAVDVEMLRPVQLVDSLGLVPGSLLPLRLAEIDVDGFARVTKVTSCPAIESGEGQVVTARYVTRHASNRVRVTLSDGSEIITTDIHPFWEPDHCQWTRAGELQPGTKVDTLENNLTVQSVEPLQQAASVYNLEVNGHHVYRVAIDGILVHNANADCFGNLAPRVGRNAPELGGFARGISSDEILDIAKQRGVVPLLGDSKTALMNAAYEKGFWRKSASLIRDITRGHMFNDANKRTTQAVIETLMKRNGIISGPNAAQLRSIINRAALPDGTRGALTTVDEIAAALRGY